MSELSDSPPAGAAPVEEAMFEKAECKDCGLKRFDQVRAWAHQHVRETGHRVELYFGFDVR